MGTATGIGIGIADDDKDDGIVLWSPPRLLLTDADEAATELAADEAGPEMVVVAYGEVAITEAVASLLPLSCG
jgi:hypothetical protein